VERSALAGELDANACGVGVGCAEPAGGAAAIGVVGIASGRGRDDRDADRATDAGACRGRGPARRERAVRPGRELDGRDTDGAAEVRGRRAERARGGRGPAATALARTA
jgi:hypothetical protein